jgi:hypothetical protein
MHTLSPRCNSSTMEKLRRFDPRQRTPTMRLVHDQLLLPFHCSTPPLDPRQRRLPPWEDGGEAHVRPWRTVTARCSDLDSGGGAGVDVFHSRLRYLLETTIVASHIHKLFMLGIVYFAFQKMQHLVEVRDVLDQRWHYVLITWKTLCETTYIAPKRRYEQSNGVTLETYGDA